MMNLTSALSAQHKVFVLDSWPFAEQILKGTPLPLFSALLEASARSETRLLLSEINLGEILYLVAKKQGSARSEAIIQTIRQLPLHIVPVSSGDVLAAARLKSQHAISYADGFCASLAVAHGAAVVTGDPDFLLLQSAGVLQVEWIGA